MKEGRLEIHVAKRKQNEVLHYSIKTNRSSVEKLIACPNSSDIYLGKVEVKLETAFLEILNSSFIKHEKKDYTVICNNKTFIETINQVPELILKINKREIVYIFKILKGLK